MRILALHTDSFGGYGGIAVANRHFVEALCAMQSVKEVVALPRLMEESPEGMPEPLTFLTDGLGGKGRYVQALLRLLVSDRDFDLIWCGHIHLVPLALLAGRLTGSPVTLHVHGIDAWTPSGRWLANRLVSRIDAFISVSSITKDRFVEWSGHDLNSGFVVPNTVDFDRLSPGPKPTALLDRYNFRNRYVLMTMGRLVGPERKKGFDRILEVLPAVAEERSSVTYMIVGKGPDRARLEAKAERLGVGDRVVFAGYVPDHEKVKHFRLADQFVMPSEGEGFGLVVLEALACGTPVIASTRDGTREATAEGKFGTLVDPRNALEIRRAILEEPSTPNPATVRERFGLETYRSRVARTISCICKDDGYARAVA